jgi:hypothetical protein
VDATGFLLPILDVTHEIDEWWARLFGSALVLLVLTSVLPPLLRRLAPTRAPAESAPSQVIAIADRIELLNSDPGNRAPEIRAELARLRSLAQSLES